MQPITIHELRAFLNGHEPPCISLYQPTHRSHPENQQDPIRFRNLLGKVEASLGQKYPARDSRPLLEPFRALASNSAFWGHTQEGLAVLAGSGEFHVFPLQRAVPELAIVADSFHVKPLLRILQSADRYQILGLNRHEICLFEGNRDALDEVELAEGVPRTIQEALGEELTEPHLTVASYGAGAWSPRAPHGTPAAHHGHGGRKDEIDLDADRFFRALDRAILEHHSRPGGLPLLLASLPQYHDRFRKLSKNPFLVGEPLGYDPRAISMDRLREEAWRAVEPGYQRRLAGLASDFQGARSKDLGADQLAAVARQVAAGRVKTLLVEADRKIPGKLDPDTGHFQLGDLDHPEVDDLLDDLAELAMSKGGDVVVMPSGLMPTDSGLAAIFRF